MISLSNHAKNRCRQRGVNIERIRKLLENADIDIPVGRNCRAFCISRKHARTLKAGDHLSRLIVIYSDDTGKVVTVFHAFHRRLFRRRQTAA